MAWIYVGVEFAVSQKLDTCVYAIRHMMHISARTTPFRTSTTTTPCPFLRCAVHIGCHPVSVPNGCPICSCQPTSTRTTPCPFLRCAVHIGCRPVPVPNGCPRCSCQPTSTTKTPCPRLQCTVTIGCRPVPGPNGCPICSCRPTSTTIMWHGAGIG